MSRQYLSPAILASGGEELQTFLRDFAQQITAEINSAAPEQSDELLSKLISELAISAADLRRQRERRQKQAEGIAAAKARGVRFGPQPPPLPENFDTAHRAWRNGEMSLREAAANCHMPKSTFYNIALRKEKVFSDDSPTAVSG